MAISKSLLMKNGVTATYWKITNIAVDTQGLTSSLTLSPFLSADTAAARNRPVGPSKVYLFSITEDQILSGTLDDAYNNILTKAASTVPDLVGMGTHIFDPDLSGGTIV